MKRVLFLVILLAACQARVSTIPQTAPVHTGTGGIVLLPLADTPPSTIPENSAAPLVFRLENRGAFDVQYGRLWLGGVTEEYFTIDGEALETFSLSGKSRFDPIGETKLLTKQMRTKTLRRQQQSTQRIEPLLCYPYETRATVNVCVDTDPFNVVPGARRKTCNYKETVTLTGGQGGPLAVSQVDTNMLPEGKEGYRPQFTIELKNAGGGRIVAQDHFMDFCEGRSKKEYIGTVFVDATLSNAPLNCTGSRVGVGSNTIRCTGETLPLTQGNYIAPLQLRLSYGYVQSGPPITFTITPQ